MSGHDDHAGSITTGIILPAAAVGPASGHKLAEGLAALCAQLADGRGARRMCQVNRGPITENPAPVEHRRCGGRDRGTRQCIANHVRLVVVDDGLSVAAHAGMKLATHIA